MAQDTGQLRTIQRAFKTELAPSRTQARALGRAAGAARFVYNKALTLCHEVREKGDNIPSSQDLNRQLTTWKSDPELSWLY